MSFRIFVINNILVLSLLFTVFIIGNNLRSRSGIGLI